MRWHSITVTDSELIEIRKDLKRKYRREIADGRVAGYTLFACEPGAGDLILFIPPGAVMLFERMPRWKPRLRPYEGAPDLKGSMAVPVR